MSLIYYVKLIHVLSAMVFLGTGFGSAWYKFRADRSGDLRVLVWTQHEIVRADWFFTVPAGLILPLSGLWLAHLYRLPLTTPWVMMGIMGFAVAGICWLPAAWLQLKMRRLADAALENGTPLDPAFHQAHRIWLALGLPSFGAAVFTVWVMVSKIGWPW